MKTNLLILFILGLMGPALSQDLCSDYSTCNECYNQDKARCGWCASDANGGGACINMTLTGAPITPCPAGFWNPTCCSQYTSCNACSDSRTRCIWCQRGSSVNGGKCLPYGGTGEPMLGGCDADYYTNWCCDNYETCDACSNSNTRCQWCETGSSVNGGKCIPWGGTGAPMWGGCDSGYYTNWCCRDLQTCEDCTTKRWRCNWCGEASTVNPGQCLPYSGTGAPMYGGCDGRNYTSMCPATPCPPNCAACDSTGVCTRCVIGYYGSSCQNQCSAGCDSLGGCDMDTGECFGCQNATSCGFNCTDQCMNGWNLCASCNQSCGQCTSCSQGSYGPQCNSTCSNCIGFACDSTGECSTQCTAGWSGSDCNTPCTETCSGDEVCVNNECTCPYGYVSGLLGCSKANLGISCDECKSLASAAHTAAEIAHSYSTYEEALEALESVSCFFLPFPLNVGCAVAISSEGAGFVILSQMTEDLLDDTFCEAWGACTSTVTA